MRSFITTSVLLASSIPLTFAQASSKRGLVYVPSQNPSDDSLWDSSTSDLTWYYNYSPTPTAEYDQTKLQFVPMLWGSSVGFFDTVSGLIKGGMKINYVLAFNEPDGCANGGSCVDAQTAAATWMKEVEPLKELGVKLGAPAVTGAPSGFTWLQSFFEACNGNCTADFIPVHWYGNFEGLASHVGQVNATYENMTMWITEYAYAGASLSDSQTFYNESSQFFDRIPYITHYSYFGAFRSSVSNVGANVAMLTSGGQLTDIGSWYLGGSATGNVPSSGTTLVRFAGWTLVTVAAVFWSFM